MSADLVGFKGNWPTNNGCQQYSSCMLRTSLSKFRCSLPGQLGTSLQFSFVGSRTELEIVCRDFVAGVVSSCHQSKR